MHYELFALLFASLLFLVGFGRPFDGTSGLSFSLAGHLPQRPGQWLFEKAALLFEKESEVLDQFKKEVEKGVTGLKESVKKQLEEIQNATDKKASKEDIDAIKQGIDDDLKKMQDSIDEVLIQSKRHQEEKPAARKSIPQQIEEGMKRLKSEVAKDGKLKNLPKRDGAEVDIDLKAVSTMLSSYALANANAITMLRGIEMEPGVAKDPTTPLFLTDLIEVGFTDSHTIQWAERILLEGGAGQTAEGAMFPQISTKYDTVSATSKKTAAYAKISEEMLEDVEFVQSEIIEEIQTGSNSIGVALENQLLTGDGVGQNHKGLFTQATAFAFPTGFKKQAAPSIYDAIVAVILVLQKANFTPSHILINPSTMANLLTTKDSTGQYVLVPFMTQNGVVINGVRLVVSNRIAEDNFLIGDMKKAKLFIRRQLNLKFFDQNEDDGLKDLYTIAGSTRAIFRVKTPDLKAFVKGTFAAVITAITAP
ncbi:Major capsid protein Gp5 [Fibrella aestuarina BUZ 2]|uniref:Major capsid protein Gp5 n=1 Tax=Fibrella aestuarina BUZ 2 TaxID=1166018 RepID=I0KCY2_9BACT|nr:phage major capsid protein [Fibrella aestuarina]CCH01985.1 Major capsid protein Gp5 [Fibrella aestuarina BUZ 2]